MKRNFDLKGFKLVEGDPNEVTSNELLVITNPSTGKIQDIQKRGSSGKLESILFDKVSFTITPIPTDATVVINDVKTSSEYVLKGSRVHWEVYKEGFIPQEGINDIDIDLERTIVLTKEYGVTAKEDI